MSPRLRPLRMVALVTSLALGALFVAYRASSASRGTEAPPPTPPAASPTAGASPAAIPEAAKPQEAPTYFPGSKSGIFRPESPTRPAPAPTPPLQAPAK